MITTKLQIHRRAWMNPQTKIVKGVRVRPYYDGQVYVSEDGKYAAVPTSKSSRKTSIFKDGHGKYIINKFKQKVYLAKAVISCFCQPIPEEGKYYMIGYKDGNNLNIHYKNLEWIPYHYRTNSGSSYKYYHLGHLLTINKDGSVYEKHKCLPIDDTLFDADTALFNCIEPHVNIHRPGSIFPERVEVDKLMNLAGFVNGDDATLKTPVILHRDLDYLNFESGNLEWVEATDQRFVDYQVQKKKDMAFKRQTLNPGKHLPPL